MRFGVLGPLRVEAAGEVVVAAAGDVGAAGPAKQRALLALLLLRSNEVVPRSAIVEELWDGAPPPSTSANLRTYLAGIRSLLPDAERTRVVVRPHGYLLRVAADELDAGRFAVLARQGQTAWAAGGYREAVDALRAALRLWRGEVAEDVPAGAVIARHRAALHDQRLEAWENLLAARLALGEAGALRSELRELVAVDPVRERGWALLMTALYQAGDPAGALRAFADARTALIETLGIEPGPELRRLQRLVLEGAELPGAPADARPASGPVGDARWTPVWQLPLDPGGFTGRAGDLDRVTELAEGRPGGVLAISGMAGVGKTALAVHWSHQHRDRFPDGQIYLDLRGYGTGPPLTPGTALDLLLRSVGVPAQRVPADTDGRAALWRSTLHGRRVLVLFDNARDDQQVRPLLPAVGFTVVTSRSQLRGLVVGEGAPRLMLDRLPPVEAEALLAAAIGPVRARDRRGVAELVERCGGLPLALRIVAEWAARRPDRPLGELAAELRDQRSGLAPLRLDDGAGSDVRAEPPWSGEALDGPTARLLRLLSVHPGAEFDVDGAAVLAGLPRQRTAVLLDELAAGHLLLERPDGRYAFDGLLGVHAGTQGHHGNDDGDRTAALTRLLDWYLCTAARADQCLDPDRSRPMPPPVSGPGVPVRSFRNHPEAIGWFRQEQHTLLAAVELAAREGLDEQCWQLAWVLWTFLRLTRPADTWIELYQLALEAAHRTGNRRAQAATLSILGLIHADRGEHPEAIDRFERALALYQELGAPSDQARTLDDLGIAYCRARRLAEALLHQLRALRMHEGISAPTEVLALTFTNISVTYARLNRHAEAVSCAERAVAMSRPRGDHLQLALALDSLGGAYRSAGGDAARAVSCYREAVEVNHRIGNIRGEAGNWANLARALRDTGDESGATDAWRRAAALFERLREPPAEAVRRQLARVVAAEGWSLPRLA